MREWTCGFVMAIGLVAIPDTAPAQTHAGEPAGDGTSVMCDRVTRPCAR